MADKGWIQAPHPHINRILAGAMIYMVIAAVAAPALAVPPQYKQVPNRNAQNLRGRQVRPVKRMVPPTRTMSKAKPVTTKTKAKSGWKFWRKSVKPNKPASQEKKPASKSGRISWRETIAKAREEFQVYRGDRLERWANRMKVGRSDFNKKMTVKENLADLVKKEGIDHYYADVGGKQVLHVVVDLAKGKGTREPLRRVLRRVGNETIELNYKQATKKNVYGHVAVRVGDGALYDLTGSRGVAQLPKFMEKTLQAIRGTSSLTFARKRSLRRFMESRKDNVSKSASVYFGMLFEAKPKEVRETQKIYNKRIKQVKDFSAGGGDATKGVYSCAQFLTEDVPFFNKRGIDKNIGAKGTASAARKSPELQAVVVYKMPSVNQDQLKQFP